MAGLGVANGRHETLVIARESSRMEFTVYAHEIISGSDKGLKFSASLEQSRVAVEEYRQAMRILAPTGEPVGVLTIYEIILEEPKVAIMVDLLNSPGALFEVCLVSMHPVEFTTD